MNLAGEIGCTPCAAPTLWWLGHHGFAIKNGHTIFYTDLILRDAGVPVAAEEIDHADLVLCSNLSEGHFDPGSVRTILEHSTRSKLVLPRSVADQAQAAGIPYSRMTTTDSGLRVEFFKGGEYGRIYSIPAAFTVDRQPAALHWSPRGGFPRLCFLIRFGTCTIFHSGGTLLYDELAERLKPYNVTVALLPIGESIAGAAQLARDIGARWLIPVESDPERLDRFTEHMLGHRPEQRFKLMGIGEAWAVPGFGGSTP